MKDLILTVVFLLGVANHLDMRPLDNLRALVEIFMPVEASKPVQIDWYQKQYATVDRPISGN